jgi:hypothetical protein
LQRAFSASDMVCGRVETNTDSCRMSDLGLAGTGPAFLGRLPSLQT